MQVAIIGGCWILFTFIGYGVYRSNNTSDKLKVMSCRSILKRYSKMDENDKKSIF